MIKQVKSILYIIIASSLLGGGAGDALAEGFAIYDYGARGSALGGAMLAREPDPSVVAHNAALLTGLPGSTAMAGITLIATRGAMDWRVGGVSGRTRAKSGLYPIPHAYFTRQLGERWFFGVGEFSRFGLGNEYPADWPGRHSVYDIYLQSMSLNPSLAYKATERLSLGLGVELMYVSLSQRSVIPVHVPFAGDFEVDSNMIKAKDLALGFNLALHYRIGQRWAVGLQYRSPVRVRAEGKLDLTYLGPDDATLLDIFQANFHDGTVSGVVTLPESVAAGAAFTPIPALTVEVGAVWTRWSRYQALELSLPGGGSVNYPKNWKDAWRVTMGLEYAALSWLDLRLGYNYTESPMTARDADYGVPTDGRHTFTVGLGVHDDRKSLDLGYIFVHCGSRSYVDSPIATGGSGTVESAGRGFLANQLAMSFTYKF